MAEKTKATEIKATSQATDSGIQGVLNRIDALLAETLAHPQVRDKSDRGARSRVARLLNREGVKCPSNAYWTTDHVSAFEAAHRGK